MSAQTERPGIGYPALVVVSGALVLATLYYAFFRAPFEATMGAAQKIFYFHVPVAYSMYLGAAACFVGSAAYLYNQSERGDAIARAGAEVAFLYGSLTEMSGIIWAKPIWGVYWSWEPRLLTALLSTMVYAAYVVLRNFAGDGEAERKFSAALGVLGAANLPIIHYAVQKWGGNHPSVVTGKGGGLGHPDMKVAFALGMISFTLFTTSLVWARARLHLSRNRLERAEERSLELGLLGDEALPRSPSRRPGPAARPPRSPERRSAATAGPPAGGNPAPTTVTAMTLTTSLLQPDTTPSGAPRVTAFSASAPEQDPMRTFGFTVSAYALIWAMLFGFWLLSWRRQRAIEARLGDIERALDKAQRPPASTK